MSACRGTSRRRRARLSCTLIVFSLFATRAFCEGSRLPDEAKYIEHASLLVNTSHKLAEESDAPKLHTVAKAIQSTRALACIDYNDECTKFGKFLSFAIETSRKGSLTPSERRELREKAADIRLTVEEGKRKLHEARAKSINKKN